MTALKRQLRRFRDQEDGLVMTEFLIMLPLLIWTFMALFIYWDAFRTINQAQKAAYSVADVMSRQNEVAPAYVDGMQVIAEYLMNESPNIKLRITSVQYDEPNDTHMVVFSRSPGNKMSAWTTASIASAKSRIPLMGDHDYIVIVETEVDYDPAFNVGIPNHSFDNFIVTRPRYHCVSMVGLPPCTSNL